MNRNVPMLLATLMVGLSALACQVFGTGTSSGTSLENLRLAHDEFGLQETSTFSSSDVIYVTARLNNAPQGTLVKAVWTAIDVTDTEAGYEFQEQSFDVQDESFSGTIFFKLSNGDLWPLGRYRVELYLNETSIQSLEFSVE